MSDAEAQAVKAEEAPQVEEMSSEQPLNLNELKIGYVVGLTEDNNFVFQVFGQNQGLVELLGIHGHANKQIDAAYNNAQVMGDRLVHEVGRAVQVMSQKIDYLINTVAPPKADNEIQ